jgi:hypothetical protein
VFELIGPLALKLGGQYEHTWLSPMIEVTIAINKICLSKMAKRQLLSGRTGSKTGGAANAQSTNQTADGNVPQHAFVAVPRRNEDDDGSGRQEDNAAPYLSAKKTE